MLDLPEYALCAAEDSKVLLDAVIKLQEVKHVPINLLGIFILCEYAPQLRQQRAPRTEVHHPPTQDFSRLSGL